MGSGVVTVLVVRSDRVPGQIPRMGQTVRIRGRSGLYKVLAVDLERRTADLMASGGMRGMEKDVPFQVIRPVHEKVCKAIQEFLNS